MTITMIFEKYKDKAATLEPWATSRGVGEFEVIEDLFANRPWTDINVNDLCEFPECPLFLSDEAILLHLPALVIAGQTCPNRLDISNHLVSRLSQFEPDLHCLYYSAASVRELGVSLASSFLHDESGISESIRRQFAITANQIEQLERS